MADIVQGTDEWHKLRLGKVTASRVADVIAKTKTGYSASRANYAAQLVTERLTGLPTEGFTNAAMQWGTDMEPEARAAYEFYRAEEVEQVAFVPHPTIGDAGASPDGLVGPDGLVEIKCPNTATHIETLIGRAVPGKYVTQMQWQMACTGRKWCDFVSFDPRLPESMRFFCQRVQRDDAMIAELEKEVVAFLNEVRAKVAELRRLYDQPEADEASELLMAG
ncbi:lambda exonuclease family protein [Sinorhizobium psoraleae]|uniref:YqaJ viral recombinase family protein n=1 Tax=Sinorhizobium psoraleae TaxID=520838 RepID=A0ABT4KBN3_9HYPH|nr:lambda exonuclease family protein [Sinorhizobium psoraleae]MCZ4089363.1 YqaJ viral recombinase family protein [Sinorhizobium psoraleae]